MMRKKSIIKIEIEKKFDDQKKLEIYIANIINILNGME